MKAMLVIALTTVIVEYASAGLLDWLFCDNSAGLSYNPCMLSILSSLTIIGTKKIDGYDVCDGDVSPEVFTKAPRVKWSGAKKNTNYTFILANPDDKKFRWAVSNIPGSVLRGDGNITRFQLMEYVPLHFWTWYHALIFLQTRPVPTDIEFLKTYNGDASKLTREQELCQPRVGTRFFVDK